MPPPAAKPVPNPKPEAKKKTEKEFSNLMVSMSLNVPQRVEAVTADVSVPEQKDPSKRLKALKKKLREIEELVGKKREDLSKEQAEKVDKKVSIEAEIKSLESIES